jgi:hypothetical protein
MVEVIDDGGSVVARRLRSTDVEQKVVRLFEAVSGDEDVAEFIADDAISGAFGAASKAEPTDLMSAFDVEAPALSAPASRPSPLQAQQPAPPPKKGGLDMGLHILEHIDNMDVARAQGASGQPQMSPGPIGFGPDRSK